MNISHVSIICYLLFNIHDCFHEHLKKKKKKLFQCFIMEKDA